MTFYRKISLVFFILVLGLSLYWYDLSSIYTIPDDDVQIVAQLCNDSVLYKEDYVIVDKLDIKNRKYILLESQSSDNLIFCTLIRGINGKYKLETYSDSDAQYAIFDKVDNSLFIIVYGKNPTNAESFLIKPYEQPSMSDKENIYFNIKDRYYFLDYIELKDKGEYPISFELSN